MLMILHWKEVDSIFPDLKLSSFFVTITRMFNTDAKRSNIRIFFKGKCVFYETWVNIIDCFKNLYS